MLGAQVTGHIVLLELDSQEFRDVILPRDTERCHGYRTL